MKKKLFFLFMFSLAGFIAQAQINTGIYPKSFNMKTASADIEHVEIAPMSQQAIDEAMKNDGRGATMLVAAHMLPVDKGVDNAGTWTTLADGTAVWRLELSSEGAKQIVLSFSEFHLPKGSRLFVYNQEKTMIFGPYTHEDNPSSGVFSIGLLLGDHVTIEYEAPRSFRKKTPRGIVREARRDDGLRLHIDQLSYVFRGPSPVDMGTRYYYDFNGSQYCEVNVNCPEGDDWRTQQKGVAHLFVIMGNQGGFCTGSVVNNTAQDGRPLFLTAEHCGGSAPATDMEKWIFTFGFETPGCDNVQQQPKGNVVVGAKRLATAGGNGTSDFLLLELNTTKEKLQEWDVVYNGWDREGIASPSGVGIHHPSGDVKKISTYTKQLVSSTYTDSEMTGATNAFWKTTWSPTENGHGITEGGSSGSPLFNEEGYIIGTLTGGSSYCSSPYNPDLYGKVSYHWESNGVDSSRQLAYWLDPAHTGAMRCEPLDVNSKEFDFYADRNELNEVGKVSFNAELPAKATRWLWSFPGGEPASSSEKSVEVSYAENGYYGVSLDVWFEDGSKKTLNREDYIRVGIDEGMEVLFSYDFEDCEDFAVDSFEPCTTLDKDGLETYGVDGLEFPNSGYVGSFIVGNDEKTTPASQGFFVAHSGKKLGACMSARKSPGTPENDDWLITPLLPVRDSAYFSFYATSYSTRYGKERLEVYYIDGTDTVRVSGSKYLEIPAEWTLYGYGIGASVADSVKWAVRCVSSDALALFVDDLQVKAWDFSSRSLDFEVEVDKDKVAVGEKVKFSYTADQEVSACKWILEGSSLEESTETSPEVSYSMPGIYSVSLSLEKDGEWLTKTYSSFVQVDPEMSVSELDVNFTASAVEVKPGTSVRFTNVTENMEKACVDAVLWSFPGATVKQSVEEAPEVVYEEEGNFDVALTLFSFEGSITKKEKGMITCKKDAQIENSGAGEVLSRIYPNPTRSDFYVEIPSSAIIEIFNVSGVKVFSANYAEGRHVLNHVLESGLYLISVRYDNGNTEMHKLMIR